MENLILTPIQLWSEYDPYSTPLRPTFIKYVDMDDFFEFEAYIDGDKFDNEVIRIFVRGLVPKKPTFNVSIIFINDVLGSGKISAGERQYIKDGFGVFTFDYTGYKKDETNYTKYPDSVRYANFYFSGTHLTQANPTAKETSFYVWDTVCKKVINLIKQLRGDNSKIILTGFKRGADIAWQVAATDKRVNAVATLLNAGWKEFKNYPKLAPEISMPMTDERKRWLTGAATQSYIKFISMPTLCVVPTNSMHTPLDRVSDTISLLRRNNATISLFINTGASDNITLDARYILKEWCLRLTKKDNLPQMPYIHLEKNISGDLIASVEVDKTEPIKSIKVYYSYDELDSSLRCWTSHNISEHGLNTDIPVYNETKIVFAYVTVEYENNVKLSSVPTYISIDKTEGFTITNIKRSRIIYQKDFGISGWFVEKYNTLLDIIIPEIKSGPLNILGITSRTGNLSSFSIGEYKYHSETQNLLQFNAASEKQRELKISLVSGGFGNYDTYTSTVTLPENKWKKCSLKLSDFKNKDRVPLKEWINVKKLSFEKIDGTIINNILWI